MANSKSIIKVVFILICIGVHTAKSQDLKLAGMEYSKYGNSRMENKLNSGNLAYRAIGVFVNVPTLLKNKKTILVNGLRYDWVQSSVRFSASNQSSTSAFKMITYSHRTIQRFKNDWTGSFFISMALASSFKSPVSYNDFVLRGGIAVSKKINEKLQLGGGVMACNNVLGSPPVLPLFQLVYKNKRSQVLVYFPAIAEYSYKIGAKQRFKTGGRLMFNGYYFGNEDKNNVNTNAIGKVSNAVANIGPVCSYKITKSLQLEAFGGVSTMRIYQYTDMSRNKNKFNSSTSGFFHIGLSFVPPMEK